MEGSFSFPRKVNVAISGNLNSLLRGIFDGKKEDYLIRDFKNNKDVVVWLAYNISQRYGYLYSVGAKYSFGFRDKRIEIAFVDNKTIILCKVVKDKSKLDKEAMALDIVANDIENRNKDIKSVVCLFVDSYNKRDVMKSIQEKISSRLIFVNIHEALDNESSKSILELNLLK